MLADDVYKYLGIAFVAFAMLYILLQAMTTQNQMLWPNGRGGDIIEGMTADRSSISTTVKASTDLLNDTLNIAKFAPAYDDVLIKMNTNAKTFMLATVLNNAEMIAADPGSKDAQDVIERVNKVQIFLKSLDIANDALEQDPNYKKK